MAPSADQIVDIILNRRNVFGLDIDSRIRSAANQMSARAFFEILANVDANAPDFSAFISELFSQHSTELVGLIGFASAGISSTEPTDSGSDNNQAKEHCLKLVFRDEQAAYYQYYLFPDLNPDYVLGAMRKRTGAVQHLRITIARPDAFQAFLESCHANPHLLRVEESTPDEFDRARSEVV